MSSSMLASSSLLILLYYILPCLGLRSLHTFSLLSTQHGLTSPSRAGHLCSRERLTQRAVSLGASGGSGRDGYGGDLAGCAPSVKLVRGARPPQFHICTAVATAAVAAASSCAAKRGVRESLASRRVRWCSGGVGFGAGAAVVGGCLAGGGNAQGTKRGRDSAAVVAIPISQLALS